MAYSHLHYPIITCFNTKTLLTEKNRRTKNVIFYSISFVYDINNNRNIIHLFDLYLLIPIYRHPIITPTAIKKDTLMKYPRIPRLSISKKGYK
jgi:hypothetical protein